MTIPDSVTSIGEYAFGGCNSLTAIYGKFASSDNRCLIVNGVLNSFAPAGLTEYSIPDSVTSIGKSVFNECRNLTSVTIPYGVASIGESAFAYCGSLKKASIPNSVTSIGKIAFYGCKSLTSVTIPDSVTSIGEYAFGGCNSLTSVFIGNNVTSIREYAFSFCNSLKEVYCKPTTPPTLGFDGFNSNASGRKIYVPTASVEVYKAATNWSNYADSIFADSTEN